MKPLIALCLAVLLGNIFAAQQKNRQPETKATTVAATIDHNRIVIPSSVRLPDGTLQNLRIWVDNGDAELFLSRKLAMLLGLAVTCNDHECSSPSPREIFIGGMPVPISDAVKQATIPSRPVTSASVLVPGMAVDMNLPATVLRHYDVLIDFPHHEFSIGAPGSIAFEGQSQQVAINSETGLIQIASKIENKKYDLGLDLGSSISFLSPEIFDRLAGAHPAWPQMAGAVGPAGKWGSEEELQRRVMRVDRVQYGPLFFTDVPFAEFPKNGLEPFRQRTGTESAGLIGSEALLNYRVGLDYGRSRVYFDIGRLSTLPDFDVIGLILRPELDGHFTILGVADLAGKPSLPTGPDGVEHGDQLIAVNDIPVMGATMGQVWSLLGGIPGQERKLTIERNGKTFVISATVQHFLPTDESDSTKKGR